MEVWRREHSDDVMSLLPHLLRFPDDLGLSEPKSLLICAEGFEDRSLSFIRTVKDYRFSRAFIATYEPTRKSRLSELMVECISRTQIQPEVLIYNRFAPSLFEVDVVGRFANLLSQVEEVVFDISVMSKLMVVILLNAMRDFAGRVRIVYSEPVGYKPSEEEYAQQKDNLRLAASLPSYGVHDVVRTPLLTSVIMQRSPAVIVAFTSFNEQLIRSLLSNFNPTHLLLVNGIPPSLAWREKAMQEIHADIIEEFRADNPLDREERLKRRVSTLNYVETFDMLSAIYRNYCVTNRIVLAPTGSKMQAVGCGLIKLCCPDIHIEYPTPESYLLDGFSSPELRGIHQIVFETFAKFIANLSEGAGLNG